MLLIRCHSAGVLVSTLVGRNPFLGYGHFGYSVLQNKSKFQTILTPSIQLRLRVFLGNVGFNLDRHPMARNDGRPFRAGDTNHVQTLYRWILFRGFTDYQPRCSAIGRGATVHDRCVACRPADGDRQGLYDD